ncbi:MAG: FtsX-like permease family protein [Balneolaceae bacterium]|nr:FtsX-like permease family protein [Balneolaceae bacterium]
MIRNFVKVAMRNLKKRKAYAFINIVGLSIGIACCIIISLYILNQLSYDDFNTNAEKIYRLKQTSISPTKTEEGSTTPYKAGPSLQAEYPNIVKNFVRFYDLDEEAHTLLDRETKNSFRVSNLYFTDSTFFEVFSGKLIRGNPDEVLDNPLSIVITKEKAKIYFGDEDPIGKTLSLNGIKSMAMEITGIMEPWPEESHMKFDVLASFSSLDVLYRRTPEYNESWFANPIWTYLELHEDASVQELKDQLPAFADKYYHSADRPETETVELGLQPLTDIYLHSDLDSEMNPNGSIFYIYLLSIVAGFILIIACINFMNLATARSAERGSEVGIRKVLGANREQLFAQFMGESILMSFAAMVLAVLLVYLVLPYFNSFTGKELAFDLLQNTYLFFGLIGLFIFVGIIAGIYPAVVLSGFQPVNILKGNFVKGSSGVVFRKALVTFQFMLSALLIVGTAILYMQLQHMQTKKLGFDKERIVLLPMNQNLTAWYFDQFKEQVLSHSAITSVTATSKILGSEKQTYTPYSPASLPEGEVSSIMTMRVAHDFMETYSIDILAGRSFSREYPSDKDEAILVNRAMLDLLELENPDEAVGEIFYFKRGEEDQKSYRVIGVTEDFHYTSIKKEIDPLVMPLSEGTRPIVGSMSNAVVKIAPGGIQSALSHLEKVWAEINPIDPFEYSFHDEELAKIYAPEMQMSKVYTAFSILCIIIACLGLFGLASFTATKRTKEIGIRKALGASVSGLMVLLSKEYVKLVLLANIIAWPIIYYFMSQWLQSFPSRITLGWNLVLVFLGSALISIIICVLTVSYQSVKAALINPVHSLRQE